MGTEFNDHLKSLIGSKAVLIATDDGSVFNGEIKSVTSSMVIVQASVGSLVSAPPATVGAFRGTTANIAIAHIAWVAGAGG